MKAPFERGERLSKSFLDWWHHIPEPVYDSSVQAPREWFLPIVVPVLGIIMVLVVVAQALQRAGVIK